MRRKPFKIVRNSAEFEWDLRVIPLKGSPQEVDEIQGDVNYIHIEQMSKHDFFMRIRFNGDEEMEFQIRSKMRKGPGIEIVEK